MSKQPILVCPACGTQEVVVKAVTSYMVNTGEFYCHSVKTYDSNAKAMCLECDWEGERDDMLQS